MIIFKKYKALINISLIKKNIKKYFFNISNSLLFVFGVLIKDAKYIYVNKCI